MLADPKQKIKVGVILIGIGGLLLIYIFFVTFMRSGQ